jgi:hypothetical protein
MRSAIVLLLLLACAAAAQTTNNEDSCDISVAPAATLLLPYFEVETATRAETTLLTVTNVSAQPTTAHVTLWTDYGYPALVFNLFLTGYDVQPIDLYDVIVNGVIAADEDRSGLTSCAHIEKSVPPALLADVRSALTTGRTSACNGSASAPRIGTNKGTLAAGYATIDVAWRCSMSLPNRPEYFRDEILFDNVLIGDWIILHRYSGSGDTAFGSPMVHIRAVPEGGRFGVPVPTNLPYTFYTRYLGALPRGFDRRQPLPSVFAARVTQSNKFDGPTTRLLIWREGTRGPLSAGCAGYLGTNANAAEPTPRTTGNSFMLVPEIVGFDSHENPYTYPLSVIPDSVPFIPTLPETSARYLLSSIFPPIYFAAGDDIGWFYLNLNSGLTAGTPHPSQNWVVVSTSSGFDRIYAYDAAWLGNGCSPAPPDKTKANGGTANVGPAP